MVTKYKKELFLDNEILEGMGMGGGGGDSSIYSKAKEV